jgi:DNA-binding NtrC family response regulator
MVWLWLVEIKKRSPSTQVIVMTGYPAMGTRNNSMKYGAMNYLTKPLEISKLKNVLRGLLAVQWLPYVSKREAGYSWVALR